MSLGVWVRRNKLCGWTCPVNNAAELIFTLTAASPGWPQHDFDVACGRSPYRDCLCFEDVSRECADEREQTWERGAWEGRWEVICRPVGSDLVCHFTAPHLSDHPNWPDFPTPFKEIRQRRFFGDLQMKCIMSTTRTTFDLPYMRVSDPRGHTRQHVDLAHHHQEPQRLTGTIPDSTYDTWSGTRKTAQKAIYNIPLVSFANPPRLISAL